LKKKKIKHGGLEMAPIINALNELAKKLGVETVDARPHCYD